MKVTLISFDYFDFDKNIIDTLHQKGIEAQHIDISKFRYRYKSSFEKIKNFFSKVFFRVNVKRVKMEEFVLSRLESLGPQDQILVIRPDRISRKTHEKIKGYTQKYTAYLYDSTNRFPVDHLLKGLYDTIYTFDLDDAEKYGFQFISNYIYIPKKQLLTANELPTDIFMIASIDERLPLWNKVAAYCRENGIQTDFICVGKREPAVLDAGIVYSKNNLFLEAIESRMYQSKAFLDLIRTEQNGLSFRIFEAMAYQRKIITSNQSVTRYPFYNPNNILVLNEATISEIKAFMERPFEPLTEEMYHHYTVSNWVDTVFEL
ncbi:MAG: hypothetical protein RL607_1808 [Bacteroidota bacterium]|jgi:hypothetical protein